MKKSVYMNGVIFIISVCIALFTISLAEAEPSQDEDPMPPAAGEESDDYEDDSYDDPFEDYDWQPAEDIEQIKRSMNRMFRKSFKRWVEDAGLEDVLERRSRYEPDMDIRDREDEYIIQLDVPGIEKEAIEVKVTDYVLTISGQRQIAREEREEDAEGSTTYYRRERSHGAFQRAIPLPENVKTDKINAEYEQGVLTITVPKKEPAIIEKKEHTIKVR